MEIMVMVKMFLFVLCCLWVVMLRARIGGVEVGDGLPVRIMGAINVSPESFYRGSVKLSYEDVAETAEKMVREGAEIIDIGAMSTAPYLETYVSEEAEAERLAWAVEAARSAVKVPLSADTSRSKPARAAIEAGVDAINDVRGLMNPEIPSLAAEHGLSLIICAHGIGGLRSPGEAVEAVARALKASIKKAVEAGVRLERILIDPAIGFHRETGHPWWEVDYALLSNLMKLRSLGRPIVVGVSRKSFLGAVTGRESPEERLAASVAAEALAAFLGAHVIRTHDVAEAVDAARVAEAFKKSKHYHEAP